MLARTLARDVASIHPPLNGRPFLDLLPSRMEPATHCGTFILVFVCYFDNSCCLFLRYAHYDGKATFSDFSSFGGWSAPHAKQYNGDVTVCRFV